MENAAFFENVRNAYRARAAAEPARFRVIDASRPLADVVDAVRATIAAYVRTAT